MRDQIHELFPTEDKTIYYVPYVKTENNQYVCARGSLYNTYKFIRKQLRVAGILKKNDDNQDNEHDDELNGKNFTVL